MSSITLQASQLGDTVGYMNGEIEFNYSTADIHEIWWKEKTILTTLKTGKCLYSDDTALCRMTAEILQKLKTSSSQQIIDALSQKYVTYKQDPLWKKRNYGPRTKKALDALKSNPQAWIKRTYSKAGKGCGAAMRTMPIGEVFRKDRRKIAEVAIGSSYITHTNPQGFLGGLTSALFTQFALEDVPFAEWPNLLLASLTEAKSTANDIVKFNPKATRISYEKDWEQFADSWREYRKWRFKESSPLHFEQFEDTPESRDEFYLQFVDREPKTHLHPPVVEFSADRWPGSTGLSAPLLAFDALYLSIRATCKEVTKPSELQDLLAKKRAHLLFEPLLERACLHGGDSDSTGCIAFYLLAACVGEWAVPDVYFNALEK